MNLKEALKYTDLKIRTGEKSDGCTYAPDLGIKEWCVMHDMLRRFKPISSFEADNLFFKGIMTKGFRYLPIAILYWLLVRWVAMLGGQPLPSPILLVLLTSIGLFAYFNTI